MSPCKETNDVTGHDRGRSLNLFVRCSVDDVRQCGRPSESNCCLLRAQDTGSSYVGIEASGLSLAFHRHYCPQFPASSHETSCIISARGGMRKSGEKPYLPPACLRVQAWRSSMHKIIQPLPSSASLRLKERCLARCLTVPGSLRRIRSSNA